MKQRESLAEKIAQLIESERPQPADLASIFASIEKLNHRLDKLESSLSQNSAARVSHSAHPSVERFNVAEAIADALFDAKTKEKACTFEPNARPCDNCGLCSSRGF
ncbi:MAG: hypothetical protein ACK4S4_15200 [Pyrinomonadaceae bacterium]